jgi:flagellar biosynthesis protein FlhF
MRIKSFYAGTVEAAVALARRELGPEAMLVQSRKSAAEARHLGEYEVVCAVMQDVEPATAAPPAAQETRLSLELSELRKQLEVMGKAITRSAWSGPRWSSACPAMSQLHARLMAADIHGKLANEILEAVYERSSEAPVESGWLEDAVAAELQSRIAVDPAGLRPGIPPEGPRIVALVGPPGAGKTTTLVKLAVRYGLAARCSTQLLSIDDRVAGADQLRSLAMILGTGFQALETVGALAQALEEHRGKGLILLDTPGYGARDMDQAADLAGWLSSRPDISTHLVLTATLKSADGERMAERFAIFRPGSLLFTRVDETDAFGTAFSLGVRLRKPLSFLGTGQQIPEDLEPATRERILDLLWQPRAMPGAVPFAA